MGGHLYDKRDDTAFWDEAVIRIESLMDKHLYETLKISFNGLHEEERQIFLDIACFFLGGDKATAIGIWKALGYKNPHTAIANLSLKSLMRVDKHDFEFPPWTRNKGDYLMMHDHLRDLGREIVSEESREDPCKRSRLWHPDDVRRVLRESEENSNLRGFKCCHFENVVHMESLALMKNLAFLWLDNVHLVGQEKTQFPPKLKFLRLQNCRKLAEMPPLPRGLVEARIERYLRLKTISFDVSQMNELKVLNVSHCRSLTELPGLGSLKSLTEFKLKNCMELAELPPLLRGLVQVSIEKCSRLKTISFDVSQMNELKVLNVSRCCSLTELAGFGFLQSLTELELFDCRELAELPPLPRGLVEPHIEMCSRLEIISFDVSQMNELKVFDVSQMNELKVLNVIHCENLTELLGLGSLKSLTALDLQGCKNVKNLGGMEALKYLKR